MVSASTESISALLEGLKSSDNNVRTQAEE